MVKKAVSNDVDELIKIFRRKKKMLFTSFFLNLFLLLVTYAIVGIRVFYPYHLRVALIFYSLSFLPLCYGLFHARKTFKRFHTYAFAAKYYKASKYRLFGIGILIMFAVGFLFVAPIGNNPFKELSGEKILELTNNDLSYSLIVMDKLEISGFELLNSLNLTREEIKENWDNFLSVVSESELLTERHKYFNYIPIAQREARDKSFSVAYGLYLKKYEIIHRLFSEVKKDESLQKIFNEKVEFLDADNVYITMSSRFYNPKTALRINAGKMYLSSINNYIGDLEILNKYSVDSYEYLSQNVEGTLLNSPEIIGSFTESKLFENWFPLQKNVANAMGEIYLNKRDNKFISPTQIRELKKSMQPGDVMVQRRNWYLSNMGIPGFWAHSALYTGSFSEMEVFFKDEFPYENYTSLKILLQEKFPLLYNDFLKKDADSFDNSVIEAKAPGIILQSIEESAHADYLGVLRPNINKKSILEALLRAFSNYQKPYDYNFDFETNDALVCSELVYDAYINTDEKLSFKLDEFNGRKLLSPTDIVKKFADEIGTQKEEFSFVYFLDASEEKQEAFVSSKDEFLKTLIRPKYDWDKK